MYRLISIVCSLWLLCAGTVTTAQTTRRVLFLGNSYTGVNNLPQLVKDLALSAGDTLIFDSHTPGGYTLEDHSLDPVSTGKIMAGGWDYVVLQGQSQEPVTRTHKFNLGGSQLNDWATQYNPCAVTLLYMTWGRKNGDASNCAAFPVMCTYEGMDSTLRNRYMNLASAINGEVSPVSVVWRNLRQNNPGIELYQPDESHPSAAGSYAAACSFYAAIFKKDPTLITFNYTLSAASAAIIRNAAKTEVYDSLGLWDLKRRPKSDFAYATGSGINEAIFSPVNHGVLQTYSWDFGDGTTSSVLNPTHSYTADGAYTVTLTTTNCDLQGTHTNVSDTVIEFCSHTPAITPSRPWLCAYDTLWTQPANAYQWYAGGLPIPETRQYLPDYQRYNSRNFSVLSTVNGCSELSQVYVAVPPWSGYYFDVTFGRDPCAGDTVLFTVHHILGVLPGSEIIRWYRNDTLLPQAANTDTLFITTEGAYVCEVIDPGSQCPFDTTVSSALVFDCGDLSIASRRREVLRNLYPNPASEVLTIEFTRDPGPDEMLVYSTDGRLVKVIAAAPMVKVNVAGLPSGLYYIRLNNDPKTVLKFIKQ